MHDDEGVSNPTAGPTFGELREARRRFLQGSAAAGALALGGMPFAGCSSHARRDGLVGDAGVARVQAGASRRPRMR